jgi:hypothetical protein
MLQNAMAMELLSVVPASVIHLGLERTVSVTLKVCQRLLASLVAQTMNLTALAMDNVSVTLVNVMFVLM